MIIRNIREEDRSDVAEMMQVFYASEAVSTNGSPEIFKSDIDNCINDCPYLEGYVFEDNGEILGYAMLAKSFSTEFGKRCIWIEDIYIKEAHRGKGLGGKFFNFIEENYKDVVFRLEAEEENTAAVSLYKKCGYEILPYLEMIKKQEL